MKKINKNILNLQVQLHERPILSLFKLSLPIFLGIVIYVIYHNVDLYYVGKLSSDYIASLGFIYPILFLFFGVLNGIGSAITSIIGNKYGASKFDEIKKIERIGLSFLLSYGFLFFLFILFFGKNFLTYIGVPYKLLDLTYSYIFVLSIVSIFDCYNGSIRAIFTGKGNSKTPMLIISTGAVLNIILDPIFINFYGFIGAAYATAICKIIVSSIFFIKTKKIVKLTNFFKKELVLILKIGIPASFTMILISFGNMVINYILKSFSIDAVAAIQIVTRIEDVFFLFVISVAYGAMTLVSMYLGAKSYKKLLSTIYSSLFINIGTGLVISVFFYNFSIYFINIFTDNTKVISIASNYFLHISFIYPIVAFGLSAGRLMQGLGTTFPMLIITGIRILLCGLPLALYFTFVQNKPIEYVWYSIIIASIVSFFIALVWLFNKINVILKKNATINLK